MTDPIEFEKIDNPSNKFRRVMNQKGSYCVDYTFTGSSEIKLNEWINNDFADGLLRNLNDNTIDIINDFLISIMIRDKEDKEIRYLYYKVDAIGFTFESIQKEPLSDLIKVISCDTTKYLKENDWIDSDVTFYFLIYQT
jgi:hypothetical protein